MRNFTGIKCPYCDKHFEKNDDIVVCPECGAPYHRECFEQNGCCMFLEKHKNHEPWNDNYSNEKKEKRGKKICRVCQHENNKSAKFCEKCGYPLDIKTNFNDNADNQKADSNPMFSFIFDPFNQIEKDEDFNGVSAGELADYIGPSKRYYLYEFKKAKENKRNRFNFSAFLFSSLWFFYRKQYLWGIAVFFILTLFSAYDIYCNLLKFFNPDFQINKIGMIISYSFYFLYIISKFAISLFANKIYYKHCVKKILKLKSNSPTKEQFEDRLKQKGGVNVAIVSILILVAFILASTVSYILP